MDTMTARYNYFVCKICTCQNIFVSLHRFLRRSPKSVVATTEQGLKTTQMGVMTTILGNVSKIYDY